MSDSLKRWHPPTSEAAESFPNVPCSAPDTRTKPEFVVTFRRPIQLVTVTSYDNNKKPLAPDHPDWPQLACVRSPNGNVNFGLDPRFEQTWIMQSVSIGDLASTMSLAPSEKLTLEFQNTQRKVLDKSTIDSTETMDTVENTTIDKEAVNVTRTSTKTQGWHVDATATVGTPQASLSATVGFSQSVTESNQQAVSHVTEATKKSAHQLKQLHKVEVRGVSEGFVSNRMTRVLQNPYFDRTLSINVFQLVKHFYVATAMVEIRGALLLPIDQLVFDGDFVIANSDFLAANLLDSSLLDDLPTALQGAMPSLAEDALTTAGDIARRALHLLFDDKNIFNMPNTHGKNPNPPSTSFDASITGNVDDSGLGDALNNHLEVFQTILNFYFELTRDTVPPGGPGNLIDAPDADLVIRVATALADDLTDKFKTSYTDFTKDPAATDLKNIMDNNQFSEIFRRLPGFLSIVNGILKPLLEPAQLEKDAAQQKAQAQYVLSRLLAHLNCNRSYYIQAFLRYLVDSTDNQAIVDFAKQFLESADVQSFMNVLNTVDAALDFEAAFVDKQQVVVPTANPMTNDQITSLAAKLGLGAGDTLTNPTPGIIEDLQVPCDGIHLEVAAGACVLDGVPEPKDQVSLSVQGASLQIDS